MTRKRCAKVAAGLAAALAFAMVLALTGCIGGDAGKSGRGGGATAPDGSIYAMTSVHLRTFEGGWKTFTWVYGEDGRMETFIEERPDGVVRTLTYDEFNDYGDYAVYHEVRTNASGKVTRDETCTRELFYDGSLLVQVDEDSGITTTYEYYDSGLVCSFANSQGYEHRFDERGRKIYYDGGFLNRYDRGALTITYEEDARGVTTGWVCTFANGASYHFTCDVDSAGNMVAVYDPDGALIAEATYERIANPCESARMHAPTRIGGFLVVDTMEGYIGA